MRKLGIAFDDEEVREMYLEDVIAQETGHTQLYVCVSTLLSVDGLAKRNIQVVVRFLTY
jgi:hypothetical protein